jgi:hypothetical protein
VYVNVQPPAAPNSIVANDDYMTTGHNRPVTGNVLSNDTDPDGNSMAVATQNVTVAGKGTLVLNANGSYTFDPLPDFTGPINFTYSVCDNGTPQACTKATLYIVVGPPNVLNPDFNVTNVNVQVGGNMATSNILVPGSTYGNPIGAASNPATNVPVVNPNGTYTFISGVPGVYNFTIPVCEPDQAVNCPTELLTITVNNPVTFSSPPVVNTDVATTRKGQAVTINVRANDDATSMNGSLGNPVVTVTPSNGIVQVNTNGTITYLPAAGFVGLDTFKYSVCDTSLTPDLCSNAFVFVKVLPTTTPNTTMASDDYANTYGTVPVTGNVLVNDIDPEGNTQTVAPQSLVVANGTLQLAANGQFTFTPAAGVSGPVDFSYTVCDNGTPQACTEATLHILVDKGPDYAPSVLIDNYTFLGTDTVRDFIITISNTNGTINKGAVKFYIPQFQPNMAITINANATMIDVYGGYPVANQDWNIVVQGNYYILTLKPGVQFNPGSSKFIGFSVKMLPLAPYNQTFSLTATITAGSGGDSNSQNNSYNLNVLKN